jgi:hypothetical protein
MPTYVLRIRSRGAKTHINEYYLNSTQRAVRKRELKKIFPNLEMEFNKIEIELNTGRAIFFDRNKTLFQEAQKFSNAELLRYLL